MSTAELMSSSVVRLAMDHGQFTIIGQPRLHSWMSDEDMEVLERAGDSPPSAANAGMVLVLSPHQWNFDTEITVEVWSGRPPGDPDAWDQMSQEQLVVDGDELVLGSPGGEDVLVEVPAGAYTVEISGRGFVNYGIPHDPNTEDDADPSDVWRVRMWQTPDPAPGRPTPKLWRLPGYGTPWDPANGV